MQRIVFIVQQLSQPRCIKRINTLQKAGFAVKVYGFDNGLYNDALQSLPFSVERIIKRTKEDSKAKKIVFFVKTIRKILKENKNELFYLFGFEFGTISRLLGCKNYIYEEADVSAARFSNQIIRKLLLSVDRYNIKKSIYTIFTSEGFVDYLFPKTAPKNIIILPNKLSTYFDQAKKEGLQKKSIDCKHIKFGFIGLIRYPNTIVRFAKVIGREFPQHEFHFWGEPERDYYLDEEVKTYKNVFFHGRFTNPNDLMSIYEQTDISVVCYDTMSGNVRIAEPNKIYESIFFETPLVVSLDTFLAKRVNDLKIGYAINASRDEAIIDFVNSINGDDLTVRMNSMQAIPWQEVVDDPKELIDAIKSYHK